MRTYQRHLRIFGCAALGSLMLWGCAKEKPAETAPAPATGTASTKPSDGGAAKPIRIAVVPKGSSNSFWLGVQAGAEAAAKETSGVEIMWRPPATENDATQQVDVVQTQINNHVDGILLAAVDSQAMVQPVKDAVAKKIQVVTFDSGLAKGQDVSLCYIGTDNTKGGVLAAEELAKATGEKGNVGILIFKKGSASNDDRETGFLETIKKYPNMHVVSNLEGGDPTKAADRTTDMLTANKGLVGIFAANQPNGEAAANVLKQKKLEGKVKLVAFDGSEDEVRALTDGTIQALIVQDPYRMGYEGVKTVLKAIHNEPIESKVVDSGVKVVTKDNMNTPEMQKVLNPGK